MKSRRKILVGTMFFLMLLFLVDFQKPVKAAGFEETIQSIARDAYGKKRSELELHPDDWCGYYVRYVLEQSYKQLGCDVMQYVPYASLISATRCGDEWKKGLYGEYYSWTSWSFSRDSTSSTKSTITSNLSSCIPKVGDIILVETNDNSNDGPDHLGIIVAVDRENNTFQTSEGNTGEPYNGSSWYKRENRKVKYHDYVYNSRIGKYCRNGSQGNFIHAICSIRYPYDSSSTVSFDTYDIGNVEEYNIKASVWLNNSNGNTISEIGIQCGSNKETAQERAIVTTNVNWTRSNLSYDVASYYGDLASNRLYYIRYYAVVDGIKYYSDWMEATTKKAVINFDTYNVENLYESDARLSVWMDNPQGKRISTIGLEYGKTRDDIQSKTINSDVYWTRSNLSYYLSAFLGHYLESNTQYVARYYVECDNVKYKSDWFDIKTPAGGISFDTYGEVRDITDKDATPSVWLDNSGGNNLSQIGFEWGTSRNSTQKSIITSDVEWTRAHLNYKMMPYIGLLDCEKKYFCRYYVVSNEKTYKSDWFEFMTNSPEITFDEYSVSDVGFNDATVSVWGNNPFERNLFIIGMELGENKTSTIKKVITEKVGWTRFNLNYNISKYFGKLKSDITYYVRYYVESDGRTYYSDWVDFRTKSNKVTVTYDANGGTVQPQSDTLVIGEGYILPIPIRAGYIFDGWYTEKSGGTIVLEKSQVKNVDHILYAHWIEECRHTETKIINTKEANCTEVGYLGDKYCIYCGKLIQEGEVIPALGHLWNTEYTVDKEVTATEPGQKSIHCSKCDTKKDIQVIPSEGHQHEWYNEYVTDKEPTCTTAGSKSYHCKNCSAKANITTIPATGHTGGNATCSQQAKCTSCGTLYGNTLEHTFSSQWTINRPATCTTAGSKSYHCQNCNAQKDVTTIPAIGHTGGTATCSSYAKCNICGEYYGDFGEHTYVNGACTVCGVSNESQNTVNQGDNATDKENDKQENKPDEESTKNDEENDIWEEEDKSEEESDVEVGDVLEDEILGHMYEITNRSSDQNTVEYFGNDKNKKTIVIPDKIVMDGIAYEVTSIAESAFEGNTKITKVVIGENVTKIGTKAFSKCKNLRSITMGSNVTQIGTKAFYNCSKMTKITIPEKVSKIGKSAFYGCRKLKNITIKTKKLTSSKVGAKAFKHIYSKAKVTVPKGKAKAYKKLLRSKGASSNIRVR